MAEIKITQAQKKLIEGRVLGFATCDLNSKPNVNAVACAKVVAKDKILITDNYMNKTERNLAENNKVAIVVWGKDEKEGYQFKGTAQYITEGKWKRFVEQMRENKGLLAKAAVLVTVKEIYRLA
jgi:predicted pyridoxine 5'-phosphate oxidase superfamily flavin-nucleotide-binding protein